MTSLGLQVYQKCKLIFGKYKAHEELSPVGIEGDSHLSVILTQKKPVRCKEALLWIDVTNEAPSFEWEDSNRVTGSCGPALTLG